MAIVDSFAFNYSGLTRVSPRVLQQTLSFVDENHNLVYVEWQAPLHYPGGYVMGKAAPL